MFTAWRPAIPFTCPAGGQGAPNPPGGATWVVVTGARAGAGWICRDALLLVPPSALFLKRSRTFWLTL